MNKTILCALTASAIVATTSLATAAEMQMTGVKTHPSQGEVGAVDGGMARMMTDPDGLFVNMSTTGLTPGNVHTMWLVVVNDPAQCEQGKCTSKDVLKRTYAVQADVGYAGGVIAADDGTADFNFYQAEGALSGAWFSAGLMDSATAEVHLVINDHGPVLEGRVQDMLSSYRGGCMEDSIPAPMPATARADGEPGPNTCRLVQFSIFTPEDTQS